MSDAGTAAASVTRLGLLQLVAVKGASAGERFETAVPGQPVTIGRKATNDMVLKDDTVSREHAVIEPTPDGWRIVARKPEVFLMVAGQAVPEDGALLADGDEIQLGLAVVKVTIAPLAGEEEDADRTVVFTPAVAPPPPAPPLPKPLEPPQPVVRRDATPPPDAPRARDSSAAESVRKPEPAPAPLPLEPARPEPARRGRRREIPRDRIGGFDVFAPLHDSDVCRVERAADAQSGDPVILRRVRSPQLGFFARRRFLRAVDQLRQIRHPNLLAPREAARAERDLLMVYPPMDGVGAGVVLRQGRRDLPIDLAVWIAREVARGLAHVEQVAGNALRLAVGDGEVVCGRDGRVALLLAPALPAPPSADRYSAPEEHAGGADLRAATFSLGVLLWELLAREPVLPGQQTTLRSVDTVRIQVPPTLAALTMRAVELRPEDRFGHAADLAEALEEELERLAPGYGPDAAARWLREHVPDEEGEPP
jgi:eukaryotic-like serine/threonine-protein kinase